MGLKAFNNMVSKFSRSVVAGKGEKETSEQMAEPVVSKINMQPAANLSETGEEPLQPFADRKPRQAYVCQDQREMEMRQEAQRQQQMQPMQQMQQMPPQQNARPFAAPQQQGVRGQQPVPQQQGGYQPAPMQQGSAQYPPQNMGANLSGLWLAPDGKLYSHVEYVFSLLGYNQCKQVIDYMMASVSVFLSMESIANDIEKQRCLDVIRGAAYVLGCAVNRISARGIYLISSPTVCICCDPGMPDRSKTPQGMGFVHQQSQQQGSVRQVPMSPTARQIPSGYTMQQFPAQNQPRQNPAMHQPPQQWQNQPVQRPMQPPMPQPHPGQQPMARPGAMPPPPQAMQVVNQQEQMESDPAFNTVSPTYRFKMQGTQRNQPVSFSAAAQGRRGGSRPQ